MRDLGTAIRIAAAHSLSGPVPLDYLRSIEVGIGATLPRDYKLILEKARVPTLNTEPIISFYDPAAVLAYGGSIFNLQEAPPTSWPAVPVARIGTHGDDLAFLRIGSSLTPELHLVDHELLWKPGESSNWAKPHSESMIQLLISLNDS